jgi:hypothetical protein
VAELRPRVQELRAAGGDLVVVGTGGPSFAEGFREHLGLDEAGIEVLADESRRAYDLLGFKRGLLTFTPRSIGPYVRAWLHGQRQGRQQGDALQQGGVVVVRPDGEMTFQHVSQFAGDHPKPAAVVAAVERAAAGA